MSFDFNGFLIILTLLTKNVSKMKAKFFVGFYGVIMEIKGKVHCFFEQSGTFKNEFKKLGYEAFDYDIQNNFNETDYVIDCYM